MATMAGVDANSVEPAERQVFDRQIQVWSVTLGPHEIVDSWHLWKCRKDRTTL